MMSLRFDPSFECAPHATRSIAMALTMGLNLAIVLFALLPSAPHMLNAPPPQSLLAAIVQPPPPPVPPPAVPILRAVPHVATPTVPMAVTRPLPLAMPVLPTIAPVTSIRTPPATSADAANSTGTAGDSDATIAYETATPPDYPVQALRGGIQGIVLLRVLVSTSGQPTEVVVERSSGSRLLDDAARRHVLAAWRFHPAMSECHAIAAWALVPVRFRLARY
jgi:protein TonB